MMQNRLVIRDPLLDPNQRLLGYQLHFDQPSGRTDSASVEAEQLLNRILAMQEQESDAVSRYIYFLPVTVDLIQDGRYTGLPAGVLGLIVTPDILVDQAAVDVLKVMRASGYEILLRGADLAAIRQEWLQIATLVEVYFEPGNFSLQAKIFSLLKNTSMRLAASDVASWQEYGICRKLGLHAFVGRFFMQRPVETESADKARPLSPSQSTLLQLMEGVRANADIAKLENILKQDAALSYKLLFYINSAAFGLSFEIESLRHAITLLGYDKLNRWLCVLFATSDSSTSSPVLLHTALVRGRMVELLGATLLSRAESESLFITGMFSMLDRLLATGMEEALEHVRLPEAVMDALIDGQGMYAPFLQLAVAVERHDERAEGLMDGLGLTSDQVNDAHFSALYWANQLLS